MIELDLNVIKGDGVNTISVESSISHVTLTRYCLTTFMHMNEDTASAALLLSRT